jgi:hypothetical protein
VQRQKVGADRSKKTEKAEITEKTERTEKLVPFFTKIQYFLDHDRLLTYGDLIKVAQNQAYGLLIVLLSLPSMLPAVNLGMAPIGGLITMWIGIQMAWGRRAPKLPKGISQHKIHKIMVSKALLKMERYLERFRRKDHERGPLNNRLVGILVAWVSFLLLIPVPLPFANLIPAAILALFGVAVLEERPVWGWLAAAGAALNTVYFGLSFGLIVKACIKASKYFWAWFT